MGNSPWLDSLSDDWVPVPATPTSPAPSRSIGHSRRSSLQSLQSFQGSPSRIPVPARRSVEPSPINDPKKKVSRPCHFVKREPPTPKTPRTPKTPSRLRSPVPDKTKKSPKPNLPSGRKQPPVKQPPAMDTRSPLRSVSNVSNVSAQSVQHDTVQVRPSKGKGKEGTPEWRRRLVQGELQAGEQRDLFAPIGLESVFKPPTPRVEKAEHEMIPNMMQPDNLWDFSDAPDKSYDEQGRHSLPDTHNGHGLDNGDSIVEEPKPSPRRPESRDRANSQGSPQSSRTGTLDIKKSAHLLDVDQNDASQNDTQMRTASGLEDLRNEGITPITFSRTNTVDGNGTSEVIKSALKQVTNKLERLSMAPGERPDSRASDSILFNPKVVNAMETLPDDDLLDVTSNSLPQDLSMGTLDYRGRGAFANLGRDQYLSDASFHKRRFSPPSFPSQRLSPFIPPNSRIRSSPPFFQKAHPVADPPTLPRPSSAHVKTSTFDQFEADRSEVMPSSGSPLKLFGNHDTFTNNRLLRRMSQFEETFGEVSEEDEPVSPSEEARRKGENRSFLNVKQDTWGDQSVRKSERPRSRNAAKLRVSRFGDGELDNFDFSDTSPYEPKMLNHDAPDPDSQASSRRRRYLRRNSSKTHTYDYDSDNSRSAAKVESLARSTTPPDMDHAQKQRAFSNGTEEASEVQWAPNTPAKDPTPKRRRTFLRSHSSRKQDDLGADDKQNQQADTLSLLQRSLMQHGVRDEVNGSLLRPQSSQRPRTPTPSQRSSTRKRSLPSRDLPPGGQDEFDPEGSPADGAVPVVKVTGVKEEVRKGSITTQDFLNEATKIMDIIRSKGRTAPGGLSSVEESDNEDNNQNESYEDESTREEFSRPPSREGADIRKLREPQEPNPRILSHLKKFQEQDELDFDVNASVMSLHLDDDEDSSPPLHGNQTDDNLGNLPTQGTDQHERKLSDPTSVEEDDSLPELMTLNTQVSGKSLSARSVPTGSSQSSHAKGVLSSDLVSHLIPEQVNGLTYDRYKHLWVKEKPPPSPEKPKGDESEDDPFRDIPDLSVDELQEMMMSPERTKTPNAFEDSAAAQSPLSAKAASPKTVARPQSKDGEPSVNASSAQSKISRDTSSLRNSGTRATSWISDRPKSRDISSEVEHEIQLHEGRLSKPPRRQINGNNQARVVTISFSSPLVSQIAYSDDESPTKLRREMITDGAHKSTGSENANDCQEHDQSDQPFPKRSISRIDETGEEPGDDLSLVRRDLGYPISTPVKQSGDHSLVHFRNNDHDTSYSFHLSPLPDFTLDQIDQSLQLEMSYVAQRTHPTSLRQVHGTFALATEKLVKHITEVQPFEPYWEHVRRLILRHKGLITLHKLCDFCPRLEDLDVSSNNIGQLSGIPSTLRTLKIQYNCLSNLTAWGHLVNLQYLDVSGNDLESLDGFSSLIHLRELNANDNRIRSINGVFELNGLLSLKLRNNDLTVVDFEGSELTRLQELDLSHNHITSVRDIDTLTSLSTLDLSANQLSELGLSESLLALRSLKLSSNKLHNLDASLFPSLSLLYVDQNSLTTVSELGQCHNLDVFSAREQMISNDHNAGFFDVDLGLVKDIRKVFLSSNKLSLQTLSPSVPLLSLQLLDAAACSIQTLPVDFALNFPNVKVLNLNFNSLSSINELVGVNCLSRLALAGNCLSRLRRLCQVLSRVGRTNKGKVSTLQKLDIRGNPLTLRFYPHPVRGNGRPESPRKLKATDTQPARSDNVGLDLPSVLADFGRRGEMIQSAIGEDEDDIPEKDVEIDDPYTLPPADPQADQKYLAHLDEPTRLRRRILELMLFVGTGGSVKLLDGLELRPALEEGSDMSVAWTKLEKLGVLKKKAITA
ncbi:Protein nud1 [Aspergillus melleus]|uniref:Protein nud1 n=1 Tax=Aspergillus melleus TaxID=138277 RepID=A0ACC3BBB0_9EURO|nr:Protein nud1 [Aspergillus melleus]